jgi:hypothetical protein
MEFVILSCSDNDYKSKIVVVTVVMINSCMLVLFVSKWFGGDQKLHLLILIILLGKALILGRSVALRQKLTLIAFVGFFPY